ncbi:MAG: hypothetical protein BWX63_02282 [Bacteroidetes bacterium ADurb.Bin041]|jgi:hypothetical protein|nr:MAG: hypothetical protein BWX63_02282 [Bacteroidetes bacterium ADurb.Bin041]
MKSKKNKFNIGQDEIMALSFGALNLADYLTTKRILNTGGEELNPVVDFLIKKKCFGIFKIVSTAAGMVLISIEEKPKAMSKALLGLYGLVVANNVKEILKYKTVQ